MPKAILEFQLPEEQEEFDLAQEGPGYYFALTDLDNWLRSMRKYQDQEVVKIDEMRQKIHEILEERNLQLYK